MTDAMRPLTFDDYTGQEHMLPMLRVMVEAARKRGDAVGHMLFSGPPGLGKTTVAQIVANEIGTQLHFVNAPTVNSIDKLREILFRLNENDVLFIDEIHRMPIKVEELLYPAVEDFTTELTVGPDDAVEIMQVPIPKFTLIGATTRQGMVSTPLRTRFQQIFQMRYYNADDLGVIVKKSADKLGLRMTTCGSLSIARRAKGTPRIALKLLQTVFDFATAKGQDFIDGVFCDEALMSLGIDNKGLGHLERLFLETMIHKFQGRPVGIDALSSAVGEDAGTLEEIEAYLLRIGFVNRGKGGRTATDAAVEHMKEMV